MSKFRFKAVKSTGEHYEAVRDSSDKYALYRELKKEGDTVLSAVEEKEKGSFKLASKFSGILGRVGTGEKINMARNLGSMLEAGLPMTRGLSVLERQTHNKKLKSVLLKMQENINKGGALSESFAEFPEVFPKIFVSVVKAGEESGSIAQSLKSIADQIERVHTLVKRLRGAMIYPAIVLSAMVVISVLLLIYLVPTLTQTFEELDLELPLSTRIIVGLSTFLTNNTLSSILILVSLVLTLVFLARTKKGSRAINFVLLRFPIISALVKESNSAKTTRTLSSLLSSGVDFLVAIQITKDVVQNPFYKEVLDKAGENVRKGSTIASVFLEDSAQKLYPPFVGEMASIGEETGKLSSMLANVADFYEEEVAQKTKNFSTVVEPLLMICIGLFVGIFAVSMLGPIYSLVDAL